MTPVPDSVLAHAAASTEMASSIDAGSATPSGFTSGLATADIDMKKIGQARNMLMDIKLNQVSDSVAGQTVVDPKGKPLQSCVYLINMILF